MSRSPHPILRSFRVPFAAAVLLLLLQVWAVAGPAMHPDRQQADPRVSYEQQDRRAKPSVFRQDSQAAHETCCMSVCSPAMLPALPLAVGEPCTFGHVIGTVQMRAGIEPEGLRRPPKAAG